jgi:hypothetical protein
MMIAAPFAMIAVAELSRIPLVQLLFYSRSWGIRVICMVAVASTAGLTIENFAFGIERLITLRVENVTEARKALTEAEDRAERLVMLQEQAAQSFQQRRAGLQASIQSRNEEIDRLNAQIIRIADERKVKEAAHTDRCLKVKNCNSAPYIKAMDDEARAQRAPLEAELTKQRAELLRIRAELDKIVADETAAAGRKEFENRDAQSMHAASYIEVYAHTLPAAASQLSGRSKRSSRCRWIASSRRLSKSRRRCP